jgi:hypothetical protein
MPAMGCCAGALFLAGAPRVALVFLWLFTDRLNLAFESFLMGLVGFILLPYTTTLYAAAYAPIGGVTGIGWIVVVAGLLLDIGSYSSGAYSGQRQYSTR